MQDLPDFQKKTLLGHFIYSLHDSVLASLELRRSTRNNFVNIVIVLSYFRHSSRFDSCLIVLQSSVALLSVVVSGFQLGPKWKLACSQ